MLGRLKKATPFGRKHPLYDSEEVDRLAKELIRHDGLIALGLQPRLTPLIKVFTGYPGDRDAACPRCGGMAIVEFSNGTGDACPGGSKVWCPQCGLIFAGLEDRPGSFMEKPRDFIG